MIYQVPTLTQLDDGLNVSFGSLMSNVTLIREPRVFILPFLGSRLNAYSSYGYFILNRPEEGQLFPRGIYTRIPYFVE